MYRRMLRRILLLAALTCLGTARAQAVDSAAANDHPPSCCRHEGADVAALLKNADRVYRQFKPKEAAAELLKIIRLDGRNFEALVRLARAYIDIGDSIPEQGSTWKERKLKEYTVAEDYARKAVKVDANSTWSHFWVAASVGSIAVVSRLPSRSNYERDSARAPRTFDRARCEKGRLSYFCVCTAK